MDACRLRCWEGQTETSPHIDAAVSPQQFWEMAAICAVAAIYMNLLQPITAPIISRAGPTPPPPPISASPWLWSRRVYLP